MNTNVLGAVFKRNFLSYFSNPTGYVFICVFVFLTGVAAFWPDEFFNANLANLEQLNRFFAIIMLFFVPAITMSIWAEESRQGTDELLLTIPAADIDIVLGKYLAAVAIYTVALLFSLVSNYAVLFQLGSPDVGLYLCTYFGYWLLGIAMLAVGMVASFLTRNLTVAYILGALFNAPLALMSRIDIIPALNPKVTQSIRLWSFGGQTHEFGRGMLGLSGLVYFLLIAVVMLYLCMVLIGRRHWSRRGEGSDQGFHYTVRTLALIVMTVGAVYIFGNHDVRVDATSERLSSLSQHTINLVDGLKADYDKAKKLQVQIAKLEESEKKNQPASETKADAKKGESAKTGPSKSDTKPGETKAAAKDETKKPAPAESKELAELRKEYDKLKVKGPVRIDAFVSPEVPESYVQARLNLLTVLQELKALGGDMIELEINELNRFDPMAETAKARYNIVPKDVTDVRQGAYKRESIFLGVAFTSGTAKPVILPFVERGVPAEYELVRSLCTVTQQNRKRIGVVDTDAQVFGQFSMQGPSPSWQIIAELQKQYEVVQVSPTQPIPLRKSATKPGEKDEGFDVLLAVQPSAMGPQEMNNFLAAIRAGQKAVIFEDPFTFWAQEVPGTYQPRRAPNPMMGFAQRPTEKGDIRSLWRLLGVGFSEGGEEEFSPLDEEHPSGRDQLVWQRYNPFPKLSDVINSYPEFVFIDHSCGATAPFCEEDPISSKLQHLFFPGPGFIEKKNNSVELHDRKFTPLVTTGKQAGTISVDRMVMRTPFGRSINPLRFQYYIPDPNRELVLAAHIEGTLLSRPSETGGDPLKKNAPTTETNVNVVLVGDIDMITDQFFVWRDQGESAMQEINFDFDNITFVLNALDSLAGDDRFLELRKRRPKHRTLMRFDERTAESRKASSEEREKQRKEHDDTFKNAAKEFEAEKKKLSDQVEKEKMDATAAEQRLAILINNLQSKLAAKNKENDQKYNERAKSIEDDLDAKIHRMQGLYKMWAVILPPILPLFLAAVVFFSRRSAEREGVSKKRLL